MKAAHAKIENNYELALRLENNHLKSLKSLCSLLLREVELLTTIKMEDEEIDAEEGSISLDAEVERFETNLIRSALVNSGGNQTQAARFLGVKLTTLNAKIKRYKISITDFA